MADGGVRTAEPALDRYGIDRLIRSSGRVIGCVAPDTEPGVDAADWLNITRFVEVSSDDNPLYTDVRYGAASRHHTMLAPPTFVLAVRGPGTTGVLDLVENDLTGTLARLQLTWDDSIRLGDALRGRVWVGDVCRRFTATGALVACVSSVVEYARGGAGFARGQAEVEVTEQDADAVHRRRQIHRYTPAEIERMCHDLDTEVPPRGPVPRFWSDVAVGERLPTVLRGPLTLSDLEAWLIAQGRPVRAGNLQQTWLAGRAGRRAAHPLTGWPTWDRAEAALDSAVTEPAGPEAPGELLFALAGQLVTSWMGDDAFLRRLSLSSGRPLRYGDALRLTGSVVDRYRLTGDTGTCYTAAAVRVTGVNQLDEVLLTADAVVFLPDRGRPVRLPVRGPLTCDEPVGE